MTRPEPRTIQINLSDLYEIEAAIDRLIAAVDDPRRFARTASAVKAKLKRTIRNCAIIPINYVYIESMKTFEKIGSRLVSITTDYIHPPIPYRGNDFCARYSDDDSECPNYGWGETADLAIQDLLDSYDPEDRGHDYEPNYL